MSPPAFACKLSPDSLSNRFQFPLHICCVREGGGGRSYESGRDMHEFMALVMNNMRRGLVDAEQIQCQWLIWLILCSFNVACKFSQIAYVLNYGIPYHAPPPFCLYPFFPLPASQPAQWAVQISACAGFPFKIIWPEVTSQQNCPTYLALANGRGRTTERGREGEGEGRAMQTCLIIHGCEKRRQMWHEMSLCLWHKQSLQVRVADVGSGVH